MKNKFWKLFSLIGVAIFLGIGFFIYHVSNTGYKKVGHPLSSQREYELGGMMGKGNYIDELRLTSFDRNLNAYYYIDYNDYKEKHPNTNINKDQYYKPFKEKNGLRKLLVQSTVYCFSITSDITKISVQVPYEGKVYSVKLTRKEFGDFISRNVGARSIRTERYTIIDSITKDPEKLNNFFEKFGKVRNM